MFARRFLDIKKAQDKAKKKKDMERSKKTVKNVRNAKRLRI